MHLIVRARQPGTAKGTRRPGGGRVAVFLAIGTVVGQVVARERRERRRAERAGADARRLEAVAMALARARRPEDVLDAVLTEGLAPGEARAGLIALLAGDGESLALVAQRGYDRLNLDRWGRFGLQEELPLSEAIRRGEPVYLSSSAERDRRYPLLVGETAVGYSLVCLPLAFEGRALGGLMFSFKAGQEFDAGRRALKEALAAQAAAALDRIRLDEAEREARARLAFLAEAGELLASSVDYESTLEQLAALCVPRIADRCAIDMLAADGSIERVAAARTEPDEVHRAHEPGRRERPTETPSRVLSVLRTGAPELLAAIPEEQRAEPGLHAAITVPLVARGATLGALSLVCAESARRYTQADLRLALDLARRAAVAVDKARLHDEVEGRADAARALRHIADAVVLVDPGGTPRYWNPAAGQLLGGERLPWWQRLRSQLAEQEWGQQESATLPIELDGWERWLEVSRVEFEEGCVYVLRDATEERLLERTRSEFVATASHELRTPITAVYGTFQTLLRPDLDLDHDQRERFLRIGLQESERLAQITEDLLIAGQLEAGNPKIESTRCEVRALVAELIDMAATRIDGSHALTAAIDPDVDAVRCDPLRLRQVLDNLIENAIKYSPGGGAITVTAARAKGIVRIGVADDGIGIAEADQQRIFERFVRLDPTLSRGIGGTGLGLYICRELVDRMRGRISVRSSEGRGSTFTVELPAAS